MRALAQRYLQLHTCGHNKSVFISAKHLRLVNLHWRGYHTWNRSLSDSLAHHDTEGLAEQSDVFPLSYPNSCFHDRDPFSGHLVHKLCKTRSKRPDPTNGISAIRDRQISRQSLEYLSTVHRLLHSLQSGQPHESSAPCRANVDIDKRCFGIRSL